MKSAVKNKDEVYWLNLFLNKPLPVLPNTGARLLSELSKQDITLSKISNIAEHDPIMKLHFIVAANKLNNQEAKPLTYRLNHAISTLGVDRLKDMSKNIKRLDLSRSAKQEEAKPFLQLLSKSMLCSEIVEQWQGYKITPNENQCSLYFSAMFFNIASLYLSYYAQEEIQAISYLVNEGSLTAEKAEKKILGCSISKLSKLLAQKLRLPTDIQQAHNLNKKQNVPLFSALNKAASEDSSPKKHILVGFEDLVYQDAVSILLLNKIVREIYCDWYSSTLNIFYNQAASHLGEVVRLVRYDIKQICLSFSRTHHFLGVSMPASNLLWPSNLNIREHQQVSWLGELPKVLERPNILSEEQLKDIRAKTRKGGLEKKEVRKSSLQKRPSEKLKERKSTSRQAQMEQQNKIYENAIYQIETGGKVFASHHEMISFVLDTLKKSCHIEKYCYFGIGDHNRLPKSLRASISSGFNDFIAFDSVDITLTGKDLFSKSLKRPLDLWANKMTLKKHFKNLPESATPYIDNDEFFIHSVFANNEALGLIYCKPSRRDPTPFDRQYHQFRTLVDAGISSLDSVIDAKH